MMKIICKLPVQHSAGNLNYKIKLKFRMHFQQPFTLEIFDFLLLFNFILV